MYEGCYTYSRCGDWSYAHVDRDDYTTNLRGVPGVELNSHLDIYWNDINPSSCGFWEPHRLVVWHYSAIDAALGEVDTQSINYVNGITQPRKLKLSRLLDAAPKDRVHMRK